MNRASLLDEIALRRASIADATSEFAAGELPRDEFDALVAREESAIAACERNLAATPAPVVPDAPPPSPRRHRGRYLAVALGCFLAAVVVVLVGALSPRQPGNSDTGSISTSTAQQITRLLAQGEIDQANGNDADALAAYNQVLALDASNVEALTQSGWLSFSAGSADAQLSLVRLGELRVATAVAIDPADPDSRLYQGIIAASTPGGRAAAVQQFRAFLRLKPSVTLLAVARPWLVRLGLPTR